MSDNTRSTSSGLGFFGALTLLFIALKLCGVINWSWVWVLAPLWISFIVFLIVLFIGILIIAIIGVKDL